MQKATSPCPTCPYKRGIVKTLVNPCPQCKRNNYSFYKEITQQQGEPMDMKIEKNPGKL